MKENKYEYMKIIQQLTAQGWEDVDAFEANSRGCTNLKELKFNLKKYREAGGQYRVIFRKEKKQRKR